MRIGIIGAGNIGGTIGAKWVEAGHDVMFAVREAARIAEMVASLGKQARLGTTAEAAAFGPVLLFAAPYGAWHEFATTHGDALSGKVVIDAANPYRERDGAIVDAVAKLAVGQPDTSRRFCRNLTWLKRLTRFFGRTYVIRRIGPRPGWLFRSSAMTATRWRLRLR